MSTIVRLVHLEQLISIGQAIRILSLDRSGQESLWVVLATSYETYLQGLSRTELKMQRGLGISCFPRVRPRRLSINV